MYANYYQIEIVTKLFAAQPFLSISVKDTDTDQSSFLKTFISPEDIDFKLISYPLYDLEILLNI